MDVGYLGRRSSGTAPQFSIECSVIRKGRRLEPKVVRHILHSLRIAIISIQRVIKPNLSVSGGFFDRYVTFYCGRYEFWIYAEILSFLITIFFSLYVMSVKASDSNARQEKYFIIFKRSQENIPYYLRVADNFPFTLEVVI